MSHANPTPAQQHAFRQAQQHALGLGQRKWMEIYESGAYTGLRIVKYLVDVAGKNATMFLLDPKGSIAGVTALRIKNRDLKHMSPTWNLYSGRCTSFAVKAVMELGPSVTETGRKVFDWKIYDLTRHRVARCFKTGVVIDSSSTVIGGAFPLNPGEWARFPESNASWQFKKLTSSSSNGKFKFECHGNASGKIVSLNDLKWMQNIES